MDKDELLKKNAIDENNIFYRPDLSTDDNYESTANIKTDTQKKVKDPIETIVKKTKDKLKNIDTIRVITPKYINDLIDGPFKVISEIIKDMDDDSGKAIPDSTISIDPDVDVDVDVDTDTDSDNENDTFPDDPFEDIVPDDIIIDYTYNNKVDVIKKEYDNDLISIADDYIDNIKTIISQSNYDLISVLKDLSPSDILSLTDDYKISSADIPQDFKHLSDLVNRSKIGRDTRTRMYNKLFNVDRTINHIRICKAGAMQRIRYYEANYIDEKSYRTAVSNRILENSRYIYDNKYKQNLIALYKYLYSSVIVLKECVNMYVNELQAKSILKKEVSK